MLKFGSKGEDVMVLQGRLNALGFVLAVDGHFGAKTEAAVKQLQRQSGLVVDGVVGAKTQAALQQKDLTKYLKEQDLIDAANALGVDTATVKAVTKVEAAGSGFLIDGRPKILYERHIFYRELAQKNKALLATAAQKRPDICNKDSGGYRGGAAEWARYAAAAAIDLSCAQKSASWGLFQILGRNFKAAGFEEVADFAQAMHLDERSQLMAFVSFVQADKKMWGALKKQDWATFACCYNGPAYKRNNYDDKLKNAYRHFAEMALV